jgi:hypothetical protein
VEKAALAIGLGAIGLYVVWRLAQTKKEPIAVTPPTLEQTLDQAGAVIVKTALNRVGKAVKEIATGTSGSQFKTYGQLSDFEFLKYLLCNAYHQGIGGNTLSTRAAKQMAPGISVAPGDGDCNPTNPRPGVIRYRDSHGGPYETTFGPKSLATLWTSA